MNSLFENIGTNWSVITHDVVNVYLPLFCLGLIALCVWSTRNYKRSLDQEKADELNTAQKQIDHLRLKNINQGIEIETLKGELKTTNGALRRIADKLVTAESDVQRLTDERQTLKPKRNPDGTFAVTTGKGHQRKRKPETEPERDWTQATEEELLAEAKRRYPVGTKIIPLNLDLMNGEPESTIVNGAYDFRGAGNLYGIWCDSCRWRSTLYSNGRWAKIIS